jgi:hypothetical protein
VLTRTLIVPFPYIVKWVETQRYEYTKLQRATSDTDDPVFTSIPLAATIATTTTPTLKTVTNANHNNSSSNRPANPRLTPERLHRLESIGFEWKVKNKMKRYYDKLWDGMFQTLLDFKKKYGHCNVPKRFSENARLGTWVHTQYVIEHEKEWVCHHHLVSSHRVVSLVRCVHCLSLCIYL